jgi:asparagine synthetase B (glutamine-hydrolysing)
MKIYESDWLGFKTYFYNKKTKKVSSNINDVIDYQNLEFDEEGLFNYLKWGYSVFGKTVIKNVEYLPPHSVLSIGEGVFEVKTLPDPCLNFLEYPSKEDDVLSMLKIKINEQINEFEMKDKKIIIPTSGGYDSRLLNLLVDNKHKINAFGYGISKKQENSSEVIYGKEVCRILNINYKQIFLGDFHNYVEEWFDIFGPSVHYHGMYHIEFYKKIKKIMGDNLVVFSGIIGDIWSGKTFPEINSPSEVFNLGLSYTYSIDPEYLLIKRKSDGEEEYFENKKNYLKIPQYRIIESMRFKIMLLRYLMIVPEFLEMSSYSPFLDIKIAMSMINLPKERRIDRKWQEDFFKKNGVSNEELGHLKQHVDENNTSDLDAQNKIPLGPLDSGVLHRIIHPNIIDAINKEKNRNLKAYCMMNVLLPIEKIIKIAMKNEKCVL